MGLRKLTGANRGSRGTDRIRTLAEKNCRLVDKGHRAANMVHTGATERLEGN